MSLLALRSPVIGAAAAVLVALLTYLTGYYIIVQLLFLGVLAGGFYAIAASGLSLIYGVLKVLNLAHGELIVLGAYASFSVFTFFRLDPLLASGINMAVLSLVGLLFYKILVSPVFRFGFDAILIVSFGFMIFLQAFMTFIWTGNVRGVETGYTGYSMILGPLIVPLTRLLVLVVALIVLVLLRFFMTHTFSGKAIRASSQDWVAAELVGVNVSRIHMLSFAIGVALAGLAGAFVSVLYSFSPTTGPPLLLKLLTVIVLGGVGSIAGTLVAGILLGIVESLSSFYWGMGYSELVIFILFITILVVRPAGLFRRV